MYVYIMVRRSYLLCALCCTMSQPSQPASSCDNIHATPMILCQYALELCHVFVQPVSSYSNHGFIKQPEQIIGRRAKTSKKARKRQSSPRCWDSRTKRSQVGPAASPRGQGLASESPEDRQARLQRVSANQRERLATESAEEREARLWVMSANQHARA